LVPQSALWKKEGKTAAEICTAKRVGLRTSMNEQQMVLQRQLSTGWLWALKMASSEVWRKRATAVICTERSTELRTPMKALEREQLWALKMASSETWRKRSTAVICTGRSTE